MAPAKETDRPGMLPCGHTHAKESYNRWRTIHSSRNYRHFGSAKWIHMMGGNVYNAYPIYDWKTSDIWIANGKVQMGNLQPALRSLLSGWYPLGRQRVASPFISQALSTLSRYIRQSIRIHGARW